MSDLNYSRDTVTLADFTTATSTEVGPDEFSTVEILEIGKGEGYYLGQGDSTNPLQAEGSIRGDIQDGGNADIDGRFRLVVLNSQNNVVNRGVLATGTIDDIEQTRANSIDGAIQPFVNKEVKEPYKIGLQLKTGSGTSTYSNANSNITADVWIGEALN